jgi:hypothetical protein
MYCRTKKRQLGSVFEINTEEYYWLTYWTDFFSYDQADTSLLPQTRLQITHAVHLPTSLNNSYI